MSNLCSNLHSQGFIRVSEGKLTLLPLQINPLMVLLSQHNVQVSYIPYGTNCLLIFYSFLIELKFVFLEHSLGQGTSG